MTSSIQWIGDNIVTIFNYLSFMDCMTISAVMVIITATHRLGMWPYSLVALPGTIMHELAHYIMAQIFFARPYLPSLWPVREGTNWTLGSVKFIPTLINRVPIGLAPFLLFPVGMWYALGVMTQAQGVWYVIHGWIVGTIFLSGFPSRQDWGVAAPPILILLALFGVYWWGINKGFV